MTRRGGDNIRAGTVQRVQHKGGNDEDTTLLGFWQPLNGSEPLQANIVLIELRVRCRNAGNMPRRLKQAPVVQGDVVLAAVHKIGHRFFAVTDGGGVLVKKNKEQIAAAESSTAATYYLFQYISSTICLALYNATYLDAI